MSSTVASTQYPPPPPAISRPATEAKAAPSTNGPDADATAGRVPPPSGAWQGVSWFAFALGAITFVYSVWYAPEITVSDRYFLYTACLFGWFGALSVSKSVRDKQEGIPVTALFYGLSWVAALAPFVLVGYNLIYDATMPQTNRGLIGMAYALSVFAVLAIAKNERDRQAARTPAPSKSSVAPR